MSLTRQVALATVLAAAGIGTAPARQAGEEPRPTDIVEHQIVALSEVRILVTDRFGRAVTDLRPEELRVFESKREQRVAFLEALAAPRAVQERTGSPREVEVVESIPPAYVTGRRLLLAFDVRNSRKSVRKRWSEAAEGWLATEMRPEDRVAIAVLDNEIEWVASFTADRDVLIEALREVVLRRGASRDANRNLSRLMNDIRTCREASSGRIDAGQSENCAYGAARMHASRWHAHSQASVAALARLAEGLAAVPGRKMVVLFSEGIVDDPGMMATYAILASFGTEGWFPDIQKIKRRLGRDVHRELAAMQRVARAADVSFFTLNTANTAGGELAGNLEHGTALPRTAIGLDAWDEVGRSTRETLAVIARETGGRAFEGLHDLDENLRSAADGFFGMYTVGYYRADPESETGTVRVEVDRPRTVVTVQAGDS